MDDNKLMKISLTVALVGLAALFFISPMIPYDSDLNTALLGDKVSLKGKVAAVHPADNFQIIELTPYTKTQVVLFEKKDIRINDSVEIMGKVEEYNGRKEIVAQKVRKI